MVNNNLAKTIALEPINYDGLNKNQKFAHFLVIIGPEASAELLKDFNDGELEPICREIAAIKLIDRVTQGKIIEEFSSIIGESVGGLLGGSIFAQRALEKAKGDYKAANILGRIAPIGTTTDLIKEISEMESRQIFNLMRNEQAQTIAFLISHLHMDKAAEVVGMLPQGTREEVLEQVGSMEQTSLEIVAKVVQCLKKHISSKDRYTIHKSGGVRSVADLLNALPKDVSKMLLIKIEERNPSLGAFIRKKMFSFEELLKLDTSALQRITREIEMNDLVLALKSASQPLMDAMFKAISKRAAETLKEEMEVMGPVRMKDVEAAQDRIIQTVRRLEEEGEIALDQGNDVTIS